MSKWSVTEPRRLSFDAPVTTVQVRVGDGAVNVVGTDEDSVRLDVSELEGSPLTVTQTGGTVCIAYDDWPWKGFLKRFDRKGRQQWLRRAVISLTVPAGARVEVGSVGATTVVTGIEGPTEVKGVTGDTTLVGLTGPVAAETVSGNVEAQGITGDLRFTSISGDLTVFEGAGSSVRADSVSGSLMVDIDPVGAPADIGLTNVSGEVAVRLPHPADADVEVNTTGGSVSNAFEGLAVSDMWGAKRVSGRLGSGRGDLKVTTVTGAVALLRKSPTEEDPYDEVPPTTPPAEKKVF
ncbi:DUF4097 family beta strand repeat-containing protein [Streptomyces sp. NPDC050658]|uniref:DUF4097 family beta strand repeat-containing protein n=1 Tax=unclassified Streptomyces TaxID=2593676 RepID=UPI003420F4DE